MNICIIGSGGRESALAWKISQSEKCTKLFIVPGNGGSVLYGQNVQLDMDDIDQLARFLLEERISMLIVGPENPLVQGLTDKLKAIKSLDHLQIIGPSRAGAMLEGSKAFAKEFMKAYGIPTASYAKFSAGEEAMAMRYLDGQKPPYVLKADGLAAGKGVLIIHDLNEAKSEVRNMLSGKFGAASASIVIEEFLDGIEFSVFVVTDGREYRILPEAKDYKRRGEGDTGLNTGGMGAISPVPFVDVALMEKVEKQIIQPTIFGIRDRNMDYKGFIFFGLILVGGNPYVIEYNCRMGDPETEVVIPRLKNDLVSLLSSLYEGKLGEQVIEMEEQTAATIMLVADGYPGSYEKGKAIFGTEHIMDSLIFQAGTTLKNGELVTNGGRVIAVTSLADTLEQALETSRKNIDKIEFEGKCFRTDIGFDL